MVRGDAARRLTVPHPLATGMLSAPTPRRPRKHFVDIEELAESLKEKGQLTPALVRPVADGFELVYGERRWRAAKRNKARVGDTRASSDGGVRHDERSQRPSARR